MIKLQVFILITLSLSVVTSRDYDDNDEGRPYEFGFTIDGQQHRRESKDVNGIVNGEFGFITADGIYHVTVYATDENGSFKILSMRNVRVSGPLDEPGYQFPSKTPTGSDVPIKTVKNNPISTTTTTTTTFAPQTKNDKAPYIFTTLPSLNIPACSNCKLPSTTPRPAGGTQKLPFQFQTPQFQDKNIKNNNPNVEIIGIGNNDEKFINNGFEKLDIRFPANNLVSPQPPQQKLFPVSPQVFNPNVPIQKKPDYERISVPNPNLPVQIQTQSQKLFPVPQLDKVQVFNANSKPGEDKHPERIETSPTIQSLPVPPSISVSNSQINIPGKNPIPIRDPYPNMVDGLPRGITENDMLDLLYKFNYTLGFHGHHEKGLKNGAKVGAYFVNGRDGISRVVEYIADENGYRPKVTFINLGLDSADTPKEGSEKSFGLKGFEFTWYPI